LASDRFHIQQLDVEAVQELHTKHRWEELNKENDAIAEAKKEKKLFPGASVQWRLLQAVIASSRYLLSNHKEAWTLSLLHRAKLLFERNPTIEQAYKLPRKLNDIFLIVPSK
jgi:hypothetical protein